MSFTILGATGNTGRATAEYLLGTGQPVRVVGRTAERLQPLVELGAEALVGDQLDVDFLASAFAGAAAAYALIPVRYDAPDLIGFYDRAGEAIVAAARRSQLPRLVFLSSIGAEHSQGTGPVVGLHRQEQRLRILTTDLRILRPGYFMENLYGSLSAIRALGIHPGAIDPATAIDMVATRDIGAAAARELLEPGRNGIRVREVNGPRDLTMPEATRILGEKIGLPELAYVRVPDSEYRNALVGAGFSADVADLFLELAGGLDQGLIRPRQDRSANNTGPTSFEQLADQLAAAYHAV